AYLLKTEHQLDLPRRLQIEFSQVVQREADASGTEMTAEKIWEIFHDEYLPSSDESRHWGRFALRGARSASSDAGPDTLAADITDHGEELTVEGSGNGPVDAFVAALGTRG